MLRVSLFRFGFVVALCLSVCAAFPARAQWGGPTFAAQQPDDWMPTAGVDYGVRGGCVECQFGDVVEGEPVCSNGYVDSFNGGCNSSPNVFGGIQCGRTVCGTYGTFLSGGGANFRDTDWYHFTLTQPADVTWTAVGDAATRVFILQGTCPASSLGTAVAPACSPATVTLTNLPAGTYAAFVSTDAFSGVPCGAGYRASLNVTGCCSIECHPPGDMMEDEPECADSYVDEYNGGCNFTPNHFTQIACGVSVCGTYGTFLSAGGGSLRDTDWYRFTLAEPTTVSWTARGEARTRVFILRGSCPAASLGTAVADPCQAATVNLPNLAAGTYFAFVGTENFSGVPCGLRYRARLAAEPCGCVGDLDGDQIVSLQDLAILLARFGTLCP